MEVEFGLPQWSFGLSTYTFLGDGRIACFYTRDGRRQLALLRAGDRRPTDIAPEFSFVSHPTRLGDKLAFIGGGDTEAYTVVVLDPAANSIEVIWGSVAEGGDPKYNSPARAIDFPTDGGARG